MTSLSAWLKIQPQACEPILSALSKDRLHHAYLVVDRGGTQSRAFAHSVAQALLCHSASRVEDRPCGECAACRKMLGGNHPDSFALRPNEKGTLPIESVRELLPALYLRPQEAARKVVVIEDADSLTAAAQNALLKTLEEPPRSAFFMLTSARPKALLATVRSRVIQLTLRSQPVASVRHHLESLGVSATIAGWLTPLVSDPREDAQSIAENVGPLMEALAPVLAGKASTSEILALAEDVGADAERYDLTLALLEVALRDALASKHGARPETLYHQGTTSPHADAAAARLQDLRRTAVFNPNRTMALEGLFLQLAGCLPEQR